MMPGGDRGKGKQFVGSCTAKLLPKHNQRRSSIQTKKKTGNSGVPQNSFSFPLEAHVLTVHDNVSSNGMFRMCTQTLVLHLSVQMLMVT